MFVHLFGIKLIHFLFNFQSQLSRMGSKKMKIATSRSALFYKKMLKIIIPTGVGTLGRGSERSGWHSKYSGCRSCRSGWQSERSEWHPEYSKWHPERSGWHSDYSEWHPEYSEWHSGYFGGGLFLKTKQYCTHNQRYYPKLSLL